MRVFTSIRRVIAVGGGASAGFIASVIKPGVQLTVQLRLIGSTVNHGIAIAAERFSHRHTIAPAVATSLLGATGSTTVAVNEAVAMSQAPADLGKTPLNPAISISQSPTSHRGDPINEGVAMSLLGASGTAARSDINEGVAMSLTPVDLGKTPVNPAVEIVHVKYDLTRRVGAATATEYAVLARTDFDAATNSPGIHNATVDTCVSNVLGARSGGLQFTYTDSVDKTDLTISTVRLHFYTKAAAGITPVSTMRHQWRKGTSGAWTVLATRVPAALGTLDYLTTPDTFDITASIASWADIDAIETSVEAQITQSATTASVVVDAVELEIIATATQTV